VTGRILSWVASKRKFGPKQRLPNNTFCQEPPCDFTTVFYNVCLNATKLSLPTMTWLGDRIEWKLIEILSVSWKRCRSFDIIAKFISPSICTHPHFFVWTEESKILNQFHISNRKSYKALYPFEKWSLKPQVSQLKNVNWNRQSEASFIHLVKLTRETRKVRQLRIRHAQLFVLSPKFMHRLQTFFASLYQFQVTV